MSDQHQGPLAAGRGGAASGEVSHVSQLSQDLALLCRSEEFSDVVLLVDGHRFSAHRAVLAARSEYFRYAADTGGNRSGKGIYSHLT